MFYTDIIITNFTINNNRIINTKSNMTYNTWTMININSTIFTDRTITKPTILEIKTDNNNIIVRSSIPPSSASEIILLSSQTIVLEI